MDSLKPCPFCGGDTHYSDLDDAFHSAGCPDCDILMISLWDKESLAERWNRRARLSDAIIKADFEARPMDKP